MKNVRKHKVEDWIDISTELWSEDHDRAKFFMDTVKKIGNKGLVKDFWNLLVEYKSYDKKFGVIESDELSGSNGYLNWLVTAVGGLTVAQVFNQTGAPLMATLTNLGVTAANAAMLVNNFYCQPKAEQIQDVLEAMRIRVPELYDIELCYNKVDMDVVKNGNFVGKEAYKEAHRVWKTTLEVMGEDVLTSDNVGNWRLKSVMDKVFDKHEAEEENLNK